MSTRTRLIGPRLHNREPMIYRAKRAFLSFNFASKSLQRMHCFDSSSLICVRQFLSLNLAALYLESRLRFFNWSCVNSSSSVSRWKFSAWDDVIVSVSLTVSTVDGGRLFSQNTLLPGKQVNFSDLAHFMTHFIWHYIIKGVTYIRSEFDIQSDVRSVRISSCPLFPLQVLVKMPFLKISAVFKQI